MAKHKKQDLIIVIIWPIFASIVSYYLRANFFISTTLFLVIPSIYLSLKNRIFVKKSLFLALTALPVMVVIDYIAVTTDTWFFPTSIFPYRLLNTITFEVLFWYFFYAYFVVMFYEYFLDHHCKKYLTTRMLKNVFIYFIIILGLFLTTVLIKGSFIKIPYWYLTVGIIFAVIPIVTVLLKSPKLITKFTEATIYFAFMAFLWELVAVSLNQWTFPGTSFIGWITVFGITFPFEEFFVWIILGSGAILSWYEFFDDDRR